MSDIAKTTDLLVEAAKVIAAAADKAKANGLTTRAEAESDKHSINFTTVATAIAIVFGAASAVAGGVWFLMTIMLAPMAKQNDRIEVVQQKQGDALIGIQLDLRALYGASKTERAERLERPPVEVVPK